MKYHPNYQPSDDTYRAIRTYIHPETYIGRCSFCNKAARFHPDEFQICRACLDNSQ